MIFRSPRGRGLLIHLVGPDGAGKSTLAAALISRLEPFLRVRHSYWRPGLFPLPGQLVGRSVRGPVTDPHGRPPHARGRAFLRLIYYATDFVLGYWFIYFPVLRRGGVVVVERGWQDILIDKRRYLMTLEAPVRWLGVMVREPDVVVILAAPAEVFLARKRELTRAEIERQISAWKREAKARSVIVLDARLSPDVLVDAIIVETGLVNRLSAR